MALLQGYLAICVILSIVTVFTIRDADLRSEKLIQFLIYWPVIGLLFILSADWILRLLDHLKKEFPREKRTTKKGDGEEKGDRKKGDRKRGTGKLN